MSITSLLKTGYQYSKIGLNYAGKATKVLIHESIGDGHSVISKARKAVPGKTIFTNSKAKTQVGWNALKNDIKATANKPSIIAKAKAYYNIGVTAASAGKKLNFAQKLTAGTKGIASALKDTVKNAYKSGAVKQMRKVFANGGKITKATKLWGGIKGIAKPLCKAPFLYAATLAIFEGPKIYDAFKNGGFWAGVKETGKVCAGLAVGGALGALGTTIGGPVVGMLAYAAGEQITRNLLSDSDSEPAEVPEDENQAIQQNGVVPEEVDTTAQREEARKQLEEADAQKASQEEEQQNTAENAESSQNTVLPETLQASDTSVQQQSNPYLQNNQSYYQQYTNPFGFDAGTNIFQRFPMGYTFQYQGNQLGMM